MSQLTTAPHEPARPQQAARTWQAEMGDVLERLKAAIAPVWPLRDYVAVNPYAHLGDRPFFAARQELQTYSGCELLPTIDYFAFEYEQGRIDLGCLRAAVAELELTTGYSHELIVERIVQELESVRAGRASTAVENGASIEPEAAERVKPLSECLSRAESAVHWPHVLRNEIGKHCAAYFDEGQAAWRHPLRHYSLYDAWRQLAARDRQLAWQGLSGVCELVQGLPEDAESAIHRLLQDLRLPRQSWEPFLLSLVYSLPGWFAYARYQEQYAGRKQDFAGLLAICLCYEVAVAKHHRQDAAAIVTAAVESSRNRDLDAESGTEQELFRLILLRASERTYERSLLTDLGRSRLAPVDGSQAGLARKRAQLVFCIDVRSERFRRHLEAVSSEVETFGFAGFFGVPMATVDPASEHAQHQLPVLLQPQFKVQIGVQGAANERETFVRRRIQRRWARSAWKSFATAATSCFTFVETTGMLFGGKLLSRTLGLPRRRKVTLDGLDSAQHDALGPSFRGLEAQGITTAHQADLAAGILKNLGLTSGFARLVVLCGHACETENNPLEASLACGACGGHSGEANARFVAMLLNQANIRAALAKRGIEVPVDTYFLAAVHNTTTDQLETFDEANLPDSHVGDLQELREATGTASHRTREERAGTLSEGYGDVWRRAREWSEVRPEWGLAGNAAFIAAPRALTQACDLQGRTFLHSYDHMRDADGSVLELIMTAPLVVAHWINMQYFASSVDPSQFGSGSKTLHNVVGKFGLFSGEGGDLQTGLPLESVHDGERLQHHPLRLLALIAAPRHAIDDVLSKHEFLNDLVQNQWLHLLCIEDGATFRCHAAGSWTEADPTT